MSDKKITINGQSYLLENEKQRLLEFIIEKKLDISHSCGGNGTCGTCRVIVTNHGILTDRNPIELEIANDRGFADHERLACQNHCHDQLNIKIPT